jgi:Flp pilus assembly protein TadD
MSLTSKAPEAVAAIRAGLELTDNIRVPEAIEQFNQALALDPDCAMAHALLGSVTPGATGLAHLARAETLAATLPDAERSYIQSFAAGRRGENEASLSLLQAAVTAAPDDWRLHAQLGARLNGQFRLEEAAAELAKAAALNPTAGTIYNSLGYIRLAQGRNDDAIAAFTKYAELSPSEPNPADSLAEAQMSAGLFAEAEASFQKALAIQPSFASAWGGIAQSRFFRADWIGGRDALAKQKETSTRAVDKVDSDLALAWSYFCEGKATEGLKTLDAVEAVTKAESLDVAWAWLPIDRARMLTLSGKAAKAVALTDEAITRTAGLPGGPAADILEKSLLTRLEAEAALGKATDAQATLARLETEVAKTPASPRRESLLAYARGEAALAAKDNMAAASQFALCIPDDSYCHLEHARALKAAGDPAAAAASASALVSRHRRDWIYTWIEAQAKPLAAGAAVTTGT